MLYYNDNESYIYFLAYAKNRTELTVIELSNAVSYERGDFDAIDDNDYYDPIDAIYAAHEMMGRAERRNVALSYQPYKSRYGNPDEECDALTSPDHNEFNQMVLDAISETYDSERLKFAGVLLDVDLSDNEDTMQERLTSFIDDHASDKEKSLIILALKNKLILPYKG